MLTHKIIFFGEKKLFFTALFLFLIPLLLLFVLLETGRSVYILVPINSASSY